MNVFDEYKRPCLDGSSSTFTALFALGTFTVHTGVVSACATPAVAQS